MAKSKANKHLAKFLRSHKPAEMLREIKLAPHFGHTASNGSSHVNIYDDKGKFVTTIPMHDELAKGTELSIKKAVLKSGIFAAILLIALFITSLTFLF